MNTPAGSQARRAALPALALTASIALAAALGAVLSSSARGAETAAAAHPVVETVLDLQGINPAWQDIGWATHTVKKGAPAQVDFSAKSGWILTHSEFDKPFGGLVVRYLAPAAHGDFLEVRLDGRPGQSFPRVLITPPLTRPIADGYVEAFIDGAQLDPLGIPFSQVVLQAAKRVDAAPVSISLIGFTAGSAVATQASSGPVPVTLDAKLDCSKTHPINPFIYGAALGGKDDRWDTGVTVRRWGGNTSTTYNWELGNAWNVGRDWYFRNVSTSPGSTQFIEEGMAHGMPTALTVPIIGEVAKDTKGCSFPVSVFGAQQAAAPEDADCGNGVLADGKLIPGGTPNNRTIASPEFVERWVRALRAADHKRGSRAVRSYILDNEPMLWNVNHRDVHPEPVTYDELLDRTIRYATAIRRADPDAIIAGPALWGWTAYFYSAADNASGKGFIPKDRLLHGGKPLLAWWLESVRDYEKKNGVRLIDIVDVHFYPQAAGIGFYNGGDTDPETSARRIRSVRSLWDPTYKDESWINEPIKLIPRLRDWIDSNAPGLGVSIGEYNFGAENHISGGLAVAEALGRFGQQNIASAYYWAFPPHGSAAYWAFRAYRNYDGAGAQFPANSLQVDASDQPLASIFAAREGDKIVSVVLNEDFNNALLAKVDPGSCGTLNVKRVFSYSGGQTGPTELKALEGPGSQLVFPPASINVVEYAAKH